MNYRLRILSVSSLIPVILMSCHGSVFESHWAERPIVIDGQDGDWSAVPVHRWEAWKASLRVCNDAEYFYMLLSFENPMPPIDAGKNGVALSFARQDEESSILELRYDVSDTIASMAEPRDSFWDCLNSDQRARFQRRRVLTKNTISVATDSDSLRISSDGAQGISAARGCGPGFCGYEWKIPIHGDASKPFALGVDLGESVEIGIRFGAQKPDQASALMNPRRDVPGGPSMGKFGGSSPGKSARQKQEVRLHVKLADTVEGYGAQNGS